MREDDDAIKICSDHFKLLLFMFKFNYFLCLGHCVKYLASFHRRFPDGQQTMRNHNFDCKCTHATGLEVSEIPQNTTRR